MHHRRWRLHRPKYRRTLKCPIRSVLPALGLRLAPQILPYEHLSRLCMLGCRPKHPEPIVDPAHRRYNQQQFNPKSLTDVMAPSLAGVWIRTQAQRSAVLWPLQPDRAQGACVRALLPSDSLRAAMPTNALFCGSDSQNSRETQQRAERPTGYDGHCRNLTAEEPAEQEATGIVPVVRLATAIKAARPFTT